MKAHDQALPDDGLGQEVSISAFAQTTRGARRFHDEGQENRLIYVSELWAGSAEHHEKGPYQVAAPWAYQARAPQ